MWLLSRTCRHNYSTADVTEPICHLIINSAGNEVIRVGGGWVVSWDLHYYIYDHLKPQKYMMRIN